METKDFKHWPEQFVEFTKKCPICSMDNMVMVYRYEGAKTNRDNCGHLTYMATSGPPGVEIIWHVRGG